MTRIESWSFFQPASSGGDPTYTFAGNRLRIAAAARWPRLELQAAAQYVQFAALPQRSTGPGPLGTGALYFDHTRDANASSVSLRAMNAAVRLPGGFQIQGGRFGYTSGAEAPSEDPKIEAVKRARLDSRLIGEFEWSLYQRSFDGLRVDLDRQRWHTTAAWLRPTQGGFEDATGASLRDVSVATVTLTARPGVLAPATEIAAFAHRYDDTRVVSGRPDNSGRTAPAADIHLTTFGMAAVGSATTPSGATDWLVWTAAQRGTWYELSHAGWSVALEGGYQWRAAWQPWLRAGYLYASGDADAADERHGTFFPMLPTVRRYAFTTAYAPMNLADLFAEVIVRPSTRITARADVRGVRLAEAADRWYGGSGPTLREGTYFGYAGRPSGGASDLGRVIEGAVDVRLHRHWTVNAFAAGMRGGRAVATLFSGRWLRFGYVESVIQF